MSTTSDPSASIVIERTMPAPVDTVWQMWTDPTHFAAWYGPDGATIEVQAMDVRVSGERRISMTMHTPNGVMNMHFGGEHLEVTSPSHLAYSEAICDEAGGPVPASNTPPGHPATTQVVVDLAEDSDGTLMRMTHVGVPSDSGGAAGWAMAIDKLAIHLASLTEASSSH
ncbi:MAG: SRPBCC domain-containing protein [Ornithinimicrobium sp.]